MFIGIILIGGAVLIFLLLILIGSFIGTYNKFKIGQQDIPTQWSNVKAEYQRRADLLMNLVESTKSYKKFEKETMIEVIKARGGNFGQNKPAEMANMAGLDSVFNRLMLVMEQYPVFKADSQHNKLMEEIRITEDRVVTARTDYNEIVGDYNKMVTTFPSNLVAGMFGFQTEKFYNPNNMQNELGIVDRIDLD